jgi:hypothetical protein
VSKKARERDDVQLRTKLESSGTQAMPPFASKVRSLYRRNGWEPKPSDYGKLAQARVEIFGRVNPQQLLNPAKAEFKKGEPKT